MNSRCFVRIKTLHFHINALSAILYFALFFGPLNDTSDFPALKASFLPQGEGPVIKAERSCYFFAGQR